MHDLRRSPWENPIAIGMGCILFFTVLLIVLQSPTSLEDALRHLTYSSLLAKGEVTVSQGWSAIVYAGYFQLHPIDPWFLTHILLIPFAMLPSIVLAQKAFIIASCVALCIAFAGALRSLDVPKRASCFLMLLLFLGYTPFTLRLFLGRPVFMMVVMTIACIPIIFSRWKILVFPLMLAATLLSHLFVFPLGILGSACLWFLSMKQWKQACILAVFALLGCALGIALHPDGLEYLLYVLTVFPRLPFVNDSTEFMPGGVRSGMPLAITGLTILLLAVARLRHDVSLRKMHTHGLTLLGGISLLFFLVFLSWSRMLDMHWPILLLFLGRTLALDKDLFMDTFHAIIPRSFSTLRSLIVVVTLIACVNAGKLAHEYITTDAQRSLEPFLSSLSSAPHGARILNVDWDLMPALFAARPDLRFARGMDPGFDYFIFPRSKVLFESAQREFADQAAAEQWAREVTLHYPSDFIAISQLRYPQTVDMLSRVPFLIPQGNGTVAIFKIIKSSEPTVEKSV